MFGQQTRPNQTVSTISAPGPPWLVSLQLQLQAIYSCAKYYVQFSAIDDACGLCESGIRVAHVWSRSAINLAKR